MKHLVLTLASLLLSGSTTPDRCLGLAALSAPGLEIKATLDGAFCRASIIARPRPAARIGVELWLPPPTQWTGRYYQMGNGGFAGHIDSATLNMAAQRGDAAAATDTGHQGDGFDAHWASGRPDLVADYAYRSIKVTSDAAGVLVRTYYGRPARYRYFMGCSYGGRQAIVAASRWPEEWDGIIAGAPAFRWPAPLLGFARIQHALTASGGAISPKRLPALIAAVRAACRFGSVAGCGVRAAGNACRHGNPMTCLTTPQMRSLATIEAAGYPLAQADAEEWRQWMLRPNPVANSQLAFIRQAHFVLADRGRRSFSVSAERLRIGPQTRAAFATGNLRAFEARGGRVISYFGLADPVLPPAFAVADARAAGARSVAYRLFLIPGMAHCQGGAAAPSFGQSLATPASKNDADHDIRHALEQWVEHGRDPRHLLVNTKSGELALKPTNIDRFD